MTELHRLPLGIGQEVVLARVALCKLSARTGRLAEGDVLSALRHVHVCHSARVEHATGHSLPPVPVNDPHLLDADGHHSPVAEGQLIGAARRLRLHDWRRLHVGPHSHRSYDASVADIEVQRQLSGERRRGGWCTAAVLPAATRAQLPTETCRYLSSLGCVRWMAQEVGGVEAQESVRGLCDGDGWLQRPWQRAWQAGEEVGRLVVPAVEGDAFDVSLVLLLVLLLVCGRARLVHAAALAAGSEAFQRLAEVEEQLSGPTALTRPATTAAATAPVNAAGAATRCLDRQAR